MNSMYMHLRLAVDGIDMLLMLTEQHLRELEADCEQHLHMREADWTAFT